MPAQGGRRSRCVQWQRKCALACGRDLSTTFRSVTLRCGCWLVRYDGGAVESAPRAPAATPEAHARQPREPCHVTHWREERYDRKSPACLWVFCACHPLPLFSVTVSWSLDLVCGSSLCLSTLATITSRTSANCTALVSLHSIGTSHTSRLNKLEAFIDRGPVGCGLGGVGCSGVCAVSLCAEMHSAAALSSLHS